MNWGQPRRKVQNEKQGGRWDRWGRGGTPGGEAGGLGSMFTFNLISSRGLAMKFSKMGGIWTKGHASIREEGGGRGGGGFFSVVQGLDVSVTEDRNTLIFTFGFKFIYQDSESR